MKYSNSYIANGVAFLAFVAQFTGQDLPYDQERIVDAISVIAAIGGFAWAIYERFAKGDLKWWGKKKK